MTLGPELGATRGSHPQNDEPAFDVGGFVSLLWRRRLSILLITVVGGAAGVAYSRFTPVSYLGSARLNIVQSAGSAAATDAVARFQPLLQNESVVTAALTEAGLANLPVAEVRGAVTSRIGTPANLLVVEARWPEADAAGRIADSVARAAMAALRNQQATQAAATLDGLTKELATAGAQLEKAREAFVTFRRGNQTEASRTDLDIIATRQRELGDVQAEIPAERARLKTAQERLARTPATISGSSREVSDVATEIAAERGRLQSLRNRLAKVSPTVFLNRSTEPVPVELPNPNQNPNPNAAANVPSRADLVAEGQAAPGNFRLETFNPEYNILAQLVAASEARVAGLEARRDALIRAAESPSRRTSASPVRSELSDDLRAEGGRADVPNPEYSVVLQQALTSETRLAGLEARRDYLAGLDHNRQRQSMLTEVTLSELKQAEVQSDMTRAQQARDRIAESVVQAQRATVNQSTGLELIDQPPTAGQLAGPRTTAALARGLASGFLLAVFGVFFFSGLSTSFGRRRA